MADIFDVAEVVQKMADGFEDEVMKCLEAHKGDAVQAVKDQLRSGLRGDDSVLEPNYDNDPWFDDPESGRWYKNRDGYKAFKWRITPPSGGWLIDTPERAMNVPNLIITGERFHDLIRAERKGDAFVIDAKGDEAEAIKRKWGDDTLRLGTTATDYFNNNVILPRIAEFFGECGW